MSAQQINWKNTEKNILILLLPYVPLRKDDTQKPRTIPIKHFFKGATDREVKRFPSQMWSEGDQSDYNVDSLVEMKEGDIQVLNIK